jgi:hypothetical protein
VTPKLEHFAFHQGNFSVNQIVLSVNGILITLRHDFSAKKTSNNSYEIIQEIRMVATYTTGSCPALQKIK